MKNAKFGLEELLYLHDGIFNSKHPIYAKYASNHKANIVCNNIPNGFYSIKFDDFDLASINESALCTDPCLSVNLDTRKGSTILNIEVLDNCDFQIIIDRIDTSIAVHTLRQQAVLNARNQKTSLIKQDIARHTDLGKEYNRISFYDTIEDCIADGDDLIVDETKSPRDMDVKYLQIMKVMQDKIKLDAEQQALNAKKAELRRRENELLKF